MGRSIIVPKSNVVWNLDGGDALVNPLGTAFTLRNPLNSQIELSAVLFGGSRSCTHVTHTQLTLFR